MNNYLHFSIDDANDCLEDVAKNRYASVFENNLLGYLKALNQRCGTVVSLYAFLQTDTFSLVDFPNIYKEEFEKNASWLRIGIHGKTYTQCFKEDNSCKIYEDMYALFVGKFGKCTVDVFPRPHFFAMHETVIGTLAEKGILKGLLAADDDRECYGLTEEEKKELRYMNFYQKDGVCFFPTEKRLEECGIENLQKVFEQNKNKKMLIFFTHECFMERSDIREKISYICALAEKYKREWKFPMDID